MELKLDSLRVGALNIKKRVETLQKTNVIFLDVIFNKQNSHL